MMVRSGEKLINPSNIQVVVNYTNKPVTQEELDVIQMYANGMITKEIAGKLKVTKKAIEHLSYAARKKMNCNTIAHCVATFLRMGKIQ
jgi:DNA-binding NarL/FixJ family response regulator